MNYSSFTDESPIVLGDVETIRRRVFTIIASDLIVGRFENQKPLYSMRQIEKLLNSSWVQEVIDEIALFETENETECAGAGIIREFLEEPIEVCIPDNDIPNIKAEDVDFDTVYKEMREKKWFYDWSA